MNNPFNIWKDIRKTSKVKRISSILSSIWINIFVNSIFSVFIENPYNMKSLDIWKKIVKKQSTKLINNDILQDS